MNFVGRTKGGKVRENRGMVIVREIERERERKIKLDVRCGG
jgi:hypothetical protein